MDIPVISLYKNPDDDESIYATMLSPPGIYEIDITNLEDINIRKIY